MATNLATPFVWDIAMTAFHPAARGTGSNEWSMVVSGFQLKVVGSI